MLASFVLANMLATALPPAIPAAEPDRWNDRSDFFLRELTKTSNAIRKNDPSALARVYRLWNVAALTDNTGKLPTELLRLTRTKRLDPFVRDHLYYMLKDLAFQRGDQESVQTYVDKLGLAQNGWFIGPFENSGNSGHRQTFAPESTFDISKAYSGKTSKIKWRALDGLMPNGEAMLGHLITPSKEATAYVAFGISAQKKGKAALRIGAGDRTKVFLNGQLLFDYEGSRSADFDQINIPITLVRGEHRLVIKNSWQSRRSKVLVRLTKPKGGKLSWANIHGRRATIEASFTQSSKIPKSTHTIREPLDQINKLLSISEGRKRAELLGLRADLYTLLGLYDRSRQPSPPRTDLEEAIQLAPDVPLLRFLYGFRVARVNRPIGQAQLLETIRVDPKFTPAIVKLADFARSSGRSADERRLLRKALFLAPKDLQANIQLADAKFRNEFEREAAFFRLKQICDDERSHYCLTVLSSMAKKLGNFELSLSLGEKSLELNQQQHRLRKRLASLFFRNGNHERAIKLLRDAIKLWPYRVSNYVELIDILRGLNRITEAQEVLRIARSCFPQELSLLVLSKEIALKSGNQRLAIEALRASLAIDPNQANVRRQLNQIVGQKNELEELVDEDADKITASPISSEEKKDGLIYLLDKQAIQLYETGQFTRVHQFIIRLHDKNLSEALNNQRIYFTPGRERVEILAAEKRTREGNIIRAERITESRPRGKVAGTYVDQRWKLIQFKNINPGDSVHIRYRVDSIGPNMFGDFFGDISLLQSGAPKQRVTRLIRAPSSQPLYATQLRIDPPAIREKDGTREIKWYIAKLPPLEQEPASPPFANRSALVSVTTYRDWNELGQWYSTLIKEQFELDDAAREAGRRTLQGAATNREKIERLYEYVIKNTRYVGIELGIHGWKPFQAAETHRRRYGDCKDKATLLAALLRDNGIEATIALVRTSDRGELPVNHASMWAFNHAITFVPSENLFLDGTAEYSGTNELPYLDQGAQVLVVWPDGKTETRTLPRSSSEQNTQISILSAIISKDGRLDLSATEKVTGAFAPSLRRRFQDEDKRRFQLERRLGKYLPGVRISESRFSNLEEVEAHPEIAYEATMAKFGDTSEKTLSIPITFFDLNLRAKLASLPKRTEPLYFSYPWSTTEKTEFQLPKGFTIEEGLTDSRIESKYISMVRKFRQRGATLIVETKVSLKTNTVPIKDYNFFRKDCERIDNELSKRIKVRR
ncbi:MAG: DUF3857 domain-containing protein [Myxococcota bacterium]|nr:DUF3857 domain-containing protein [Myxococcota bacterium]